MLLVLGGGLALMFIVAPLLSLFLQTSPTSFFETAKDTEVQLSIGRTLLISFLGTLVLAVFAIPLAYLLARKNFPGKKLIISFIDLPIIIPHSAAGIALLGFISRDTVVGKFASFFGIELVGNPVGIAMAMAFVSIPFLINAARDGFLAVPRRFEHAARNLGASPARVFFTISLPLAWRNILSGLVLMFGRGMSEFGAVVIIAYHPMITPVLIYERFTQFGLKYAQPVSAVFILICLAFFILFRMLTLKTDKQNA
ncbi:MAG: ABC transporter permease [Bacteroidales bacterium]|nr:ABC transporter permease [Bacteroidales bacterium]